MRRMTLLVTFIGLGAVLAYTVGVGDARADAYACYQYDGMELGCEGCVDQGCPACDDGVCPGKNKVCLDKEKTKIVVGEGGYLNKTPVMLPCFIRYNCIPAEQQQYCSIPDYPCVKGTIGLGSQTQFVQEVLWGDCPPE